MTVLHPNILDECLFSYLNSNCKCFEVLDPPRARSDTLKKRFPRDRYGPRHKRTKRLLRGPVATRGPPRAHEMTSELQSYIYIMLMVIKQIWRGPPKQFCLTLVLSLGHSDPICMQGLFPVFKCTCFYCENNFMNTFIHFMNIFIHFMNIFIHFMNIFIYFIHIIINVLVEQWLQPKSNLVHHCQQSCD